MQNKQRPQAEHIGILGGTFNPIHNRHLEMAAAVRRALGLDRVLLMVAKAPPHKRVVDGIPALSRLGMARRAADPIVGLEASDLELMRAGKSYTIDTVRALKQALPDARFTLIVGGDMLMDFSTWRESEALLRLVSIACVPRLGGEAGAQRAAQALIQGFGADVVIPQIALSDLSSTMIRESVRLARPITGLTPPAVERYIYESGFYLPETVLRMHEACKNALTPKRFSHTIGVVSAAVELAHRFNVDGEKARLAALLHDYGRSLEWDALRHSHISEALARDVFQIRDEQVLRAIRVHTTLDEYATPLDKVVYLADMLEPGRVYEGVDDIRALARIDLDAAVVQGLRHTIEYLKSRNIPVQGDSLRAIHALTGEGPDAL